METVNQKKITPLDPEFEIIPPGAADSIPEKAITELKADHRDLATQLKELRVTNEDGYKQAAELLTRAKNRINNVEDFRKAITDPLKKEVKRIDGMFKSITEPFVMMETRFKELMGKYIDSRKNKEDLKTRHTTDGTTVVREIWDYEVTNEADVERKYLTVDHARLGREVRAGAFEVGQQKGFRVFKKTSISAGGTR